MRIHSRSKQGFTLVELMVVVTIVGVLAVLAVYGIRKYVANAKTAEAKNALGQMGKDAVNAFEGQRSPNAIVGIGGSISTTRQTCGSAAASVPTSLDAVSGKKYQSQRSDWANNADVGPSRGFPCLRFEMNTPQYYMYSYASSTPAGGSADGEKITGTANGDLNGNKIASTFTVSGTIQEGRLVIAPALGESSPEE